MSCQELTTPLGKKEKQLVNNREESEGIREFGR